MVKSFQKKFTPEEWKQIQKYHKVQAKLTKESQSNDKSLYKGKTKFSISSCTKSIASKKSINTMDNHDLIMTKPLKDSKQHLGHFDDFGQF